jgi:hypothetical protein
LNKAIADYVSGWDGNVQLVRFTGTDLLADTYKNKSILNIIGLVDSAAITFTPQANDIIKVTIFNVTSLTSGTLGKEPFPESWQPISSVRNSSAETGNPLKLN